TSRETLIDFYRKVRPAGPGWARIRAVAQLTPEEQRQKGESIPLALVGWVAGSIAIWSSLFTVGNFLYGRRGMGLLLLAVFLVSSVILVGVVNRLWSDREPA
ncbi:MAG: Na+:solute symporter, partial [Acidobacteria bacterium]|nr:Na+:solute symporter [Acidobacteriota bacterium]